MIMVQERITDTDTSDSSDCCDVNTPSHFSHDSDDSQNRNSAVSAGASGNSIIFKCEDSGSGRNSTSFPSTPNSQCASPLIIMSESSSSNSSNSNNNNVTITSDDDNSRSRSNNVNVPSNSNSKSNIPSVNNKYNIGINKNHRNKSKPKSIDYDNIRPIPSPSTMTNNNNTHENNVKNTSTGVGTGSSGPGNARKLSEPQVENVPPTGIVVPRTVPCIVLTPPSLFSPSTGVPLFPFDHMQSGKIPPTDFPSSATTVSIRCAPNNSNNAAPGPGTGTGTASAFSSAFQLNNLIDKNNIGHHDGLKYKIANSLNLSQSCRNNNNSVKNKDDGKPRHGTGTGTGTGEGVEPPKKLAFGIDQILAGEKDKGTRGFNRDMSPEPRIPIGSTPMSIGHPMEIDFNLKSYNTPPASHHHNNTTTSNNNNGVISISSNDEERMGTGGNYPSQCSECFFLSRYCRRIQFPTTTPTSASTSFTWIPSQSSGVHPVDSGPSSLLSTTGYSHHQHVGLSSYGLTGTNFSNMPTMVSCNTSGNGRRKRSWSRAVFSNLQRKGLEKRFQLQKYITKPDRRQLAATLGLTDAQVKVWFQNRRMKWRHSKEGKQGTHIPDETIIVNVDKK